MNGEDFKGYDPSRIAEVYEEGFTRRVIFGALFVGLVMLPGSIYLGLIIGQTLGAAAEWVTIILLTEIARRSFKTLKRQEVFILWYVAGAVAVGMVLWGVSGGPFTGLIWNQYLVQSPQAEGMGIAKDIPKWAVPPSSSPAITGRNLFHSDWYIPILLLLVGQILGRMNWFGMGYLLFRITSDVERLPFPLAPIAAGGATALAESTTKEESWRWRVFSTGAMVGIVFGALYIGVPALTGLIMAKPIEIFPIPFLDLTPRTESVLPAAPLGISFGLGALLIGMVLPFPIVVGGFISTILTSVMMNPILQHHGFFPNWHEGMSLLYTHFATGFDFWMSVIIGGALAIAAIGIVQAVRARVFKLEAISPPPKGRGDISISLALFLFFASTLGYVLICHKLVPDFNIWILIFFGFVWTPFHSYISARMIGLTGRGVDFPFLREASFIMSRYKGVDIWFAPIPLFDHGWTGQRFRELQLTGTKITSLIKAELLIIPVSLICSFFFWAFFWYLGQIPSATYPFTAKWWPVGVRMQCLIMTATMEGNRWLITAINKPLNIACGFGGAIALFLLISSLGLPRLFFYGLIGGVAGYPHGAIPMFLGAVLGRYYFRKRFGEARWRAYIPVLAAGYFCGMGLLAMLAVALAIVNKAVTGMPF